ncbi:MAG: hypothetical protein Q9221_001240 [Calogaya cf. arnoldii]
MSPTTSGKANEDLPTISKAYYRHWPNGRVEKICQAPVNSDKFETMFHAVARTRAQLRKLLFDRTHDVGTVGVWKSRREGKKDVAEAQFTCAKEFQKLYVKLQNVKDEMWLDGLCESLLGQGKGRKDAFPVGGRLRDFIFLQQHQNLINPFSILLTPSHVHINMSDMRLLFKYTRSPDGNFHLTPPESPSNIHPNILTCHLWNANNFIQALPTPEPDKSRIARRKLEEPQDPERERSIKEGREKLQSLLSDRIRDFGSVAAWKSRRQAEQDTCDAQRACAKEFSKLSGKLVGRRQL